MQPLAPKALLLRLLMIVALVECGIMVVLARFMDLDTWYGALLDTGLLTSLLATLLWPWLKQVDQARLAAEDSLRKKNADLTTTVRSLQRLREALDLHAIVTVTDPVGRILEANDAFCSISGFSRDELIGQTPRILNSGYHPSAFFADLWDTIKAGRIWHGEIRNRRKDGSLYWRDTTIVPFVDDTGRIEVFVAIGYDITARREQNEALTRLALVASRTTNAVVITDAAGLVLWTNEGFSRITGYTLADAIGRKPGSFLQGPGTDQATVTLLRQAVAAGESVDCEILNYNKGGRPYWVQMRIDPVHDESGRLSHFIAIESDITREREDRERLRDTSVQLRERNLALEAATIRAEQLARDAHAATRAKAEFLANMSHEIRTPMNAVVGMTDLLLDTPLNSSQREFADTIRTSGDALLALINDILDFSKIESGSLELERAPFNLRDCVEGALDLTARPAAEKGLDLLYWIEEDIPSHLLGDVTRLRQILINLVSNAVKFTSQGEVVVTFSRRPAPTGPNPPAALLHVSVRDTGIGIPANRINRLFQAFSQVDASTTRKFGGTGLGLVICQRLVTLMGGRIWVESAPDVGSDFQFEIPLQSAHASLTPYLIASIPNLAGRRLLLVDDNPTNLRILTLQTQRWGFVIACAPSGPAALALLDGGTTFDAAIIDIQMPEMDGYTLAAEIRKRRPSGQLAILALTSMGDDPARFATLDVAQVLTKPAKASALLDALTHLFVGTNVAVETPVSAFDPTLASRHPLRILLAEDQPTNKRVAQLLLSRLGYSCTTVSDGFEVLDAVSHQTFDVILLDVQMPRLDGIATTHRLCTDYPPARRPWIVALTANAMKGDRETCIAAGMDDYLAKPIGAKPLGEVLTRASQQLLLRR